MTEKPLCSNPGGACFMDGLTKKELLEIDACTGCRECLKVCPVQEVTGNYKISPAEKIRLYREFIKSTRGLKALLDPAGKGRPDRKLLEDFTRAAFECTVCGACAEACPAGISTQRLWPVLRREMVKRGIGPMGAQGDMPGVVKNTGNPYNKPALERYSPWFPSDVEVKEEAEVAYYAGCTGAYEAMPMVRGDVLVLGASETPFTMLPPEEEVCCGFPLFITGQHDMLKDLVQRLVKSYARRGVKTLVCSCPCCVNIMARDWPSYWGGPLPFKIRHITQHADWAIRKGRIKIKTPLYERLIYHDPCYLARGVGVTEEPRSVLRAITDMPLVEFYRNREKSRCCGAGGAARKVFHDNAVAIARLTIGEAHDKGADRLILGCPACYAKLNEAMEGFEKPVGITDIMELLAEVL